MATWVEMIRLLAVLVAMRMRSRLLSVRGAAIGEKTGIGPGCTFSRPWRIILGKRVVLERNVMLKLVDVQASVLIGDFCFLGKGVEVDCHNRIEIGDHVLIAPGSFLTDHNHGLRADRRLSDQACMSAPVIVEDDVWIGANAVVLPGVRLHRGAVVGAGAVVTKDVAEDDIVGGVPAEKISERRL